MSLGFEILTPPFDWDLSDAGKGPSMGWQFFTCYNSEEAYDSLEVKASQNEMDYFMAVYLSPGQVKDLVSYIREGFGREGWGGERHAPV